MTDTELETLVNDPNKTVAGDIHWTMDEDHSPAVEFRVPVESGYGVLSARGSFNALAGKLSYVLILHGTGRIYALDLGADHHNPDCHNVGEVHKHRWTEALRDKNAYVPADITKGIDDPVGVWEQFCREANIRHDGRLFAPPALQMDFFT